jgi:TfoX/Sxy family transcriptional regulator of competence genes
MSYDEDLADRIRGLLGRESDVTEQQMFGGLAFLVGGNMAVSASGQGGLMVRVDPERSEHLVATTAAEPMVMKGRPMAGWLRVPSEDVRTKRQLSRWVTTGTTYARSLPPKKAKTTRTGASHRRTR